MFLPNVRYLALYLIEVFIAEASPHRTRKYWSALLQLYLEGCVQFWGPHYLKIADKLEGVQKRTTDIRGLVELIYEERLRMSSLDKLQYRWVM